MNLGAPEIILILVALVLLFGAKKLPDLARGVGRSLRIFKAETSKMNDDDDERPTVVQAQAQAQPAPPQQIPAAAPAPQPSVEEQARQLEEQAARLRASAQADKRV
ncbi:Sec-independent protein translocase protein TatAd [Nonomuraea coxensis DSM 45129]|uniref:Sec-independent protein translocase protein TatA n=1 Tax=Nonomuraea coxensis DSM 45129 TaxID=1122611 RepID=A0ABX8U6Q3_9ACTN|nr:Sec-independent protein translocase subunit TatA [Nonomuraea coxensis]QYC42804.1 Sec-independent protein translocase protein TatAd [Nonomuraea coxensis DSM 45129]